MRYLRGEDRGQAALPPAAIEDYVAANTPIRAIDAFARGGLSPNSAADLDQAARDASFFFLRQPSKPMAPRPPAKSGRAAGSGVELTGLKRTA
jgi:hypothetical protein